MSTYGELYDDAMQDEWYAQLYEEHAELARVELRIERLRSYYAIHLDIARPAIAVLGDARNLRPVSPAASLIRATTASELGIKNLLLRPIVFGLVHSESLAGAVTDMALGHQAVDRYRDLLMGILQEFGGVDLRTYSRSGSNTPLWSELSSIQKARNRVVHRGDVPTDAQCDTAIALASTIIEQLFPQVAGRLGFHQHGPDLCKEAHLPDSYSDLLQEFAPQWPEASVRDCL